VTRRDPYETLAPVYEWLIPESLLTPEGSVAAFSQVVEELDRGARVLDCATGIGQLPVGLQLNGFAVTASDASPAMVDRTRRLARERGAELQTAVCNWDQLPDQGWTEQFDAVLCVGNSLPHARGKAARRVALRAMTAVLRPGGLLVLTSSNWELVRDLRAGFTIAEQLIERDGSYALVTYAWSIGSTWRDPHRLDVAVALSDRSGPAARYAGRLTCWPFRHEQLEADLRAVGLIPSSSTYRRTAERYLLTARAPAHARPAPDLRRTARAGRVSARQNEVFHSTGAHCVRLAGGARGRMLGRYSTTSITSYTPETGSFSTNADRADTRRVSPSSASARQRR
jgi:SAM-dependent methyltransferase